MNAPSPGPADVKVSVAMITYNHEQFIAEAIEGVLMQKTDFAVELVLGDDCSTDDTTSIIQDYAEKYPGKIKALLRSQNLGPAHSPGKNNLIAVLKACCGQYIALCEGDDFWTDPLKLHKQVVYLDARPECAMCFHNVMAVYLDRQRASHSVCPPDQKEISSLDDLLIMNFIPTCSAVYRRGLFGKIPGWFHELPIGDWPLHVLNAQYGDIGYLNEVMAVFRVHAGGIWSSRDTVMRIKQWLPMYGPLYGHLGEAHGTAIRSGASKAIAAGAAAIFDADDQNSLASSLDFIRTALVGAADAGYANRSFVRVTKARSYESLAFAAYRKRDMRTARYCYARALALDPALAGNKGILSLWFEAYFGAKASAMRKNLTSRLLREHSLR